MRFIFLYTIFMEFILLIIFFLGICIGSFLNVCIDRLPVGQDVTRGRSHCDHCKRTLSWYELIPIISWIMQLGKSKCCYKKLSIQYPIIELITGIGFVYLFVVSSNYIISLIIFCSFLVLFVTDLKFELLPTGFLILAFLGVVSQIVLSGTYLNVISGVSAGLFFFLLWYFSKGRAMGDGDIWLAILIGLVTGYPGIILALYIAFLTGAAMGVILILGKVKTLKSHIPFGPFLIFGMVVQLIFNQSILLLWSKLWF